MLINESRKIQRDDRKVDEVIEAVKIGYKLGLSANSDLTYQEKQELDNWMNQLSDFAGYIAKLVNRS